MAKTSERKYQSELLKQFQEDGHFHTTPIPDAGLAQRFGVAKVYDFFLSRRACPNAVELKQVAGKKWGWSISTLKEHQEFHLLDAHHKGVRAWVWVHHIAPLSDRNQAKYGVTQYNSLWAVPILEVIKARDVDGLTTLSPPELDSYGTKIAVNGTEILYNELIQAMREYKWDCTSRSTIKSM